MRRSEACGRKAFEQRYLPPDREAYAPRFGKPFGLLPIGNIPLTCRCAKPGCARAGRDKVYRASLASTKSGAAQTGAKPHASKGETMIKAPNAVTATLVIANLVNLATPDDALAYIDPATGSMLFQAIIGTIAAGLMAARLFWGNIMRFFNRGHSRKQSSGESTQPKNEQ